MPSHRDDRDELHHRLQVLRDTVQLWQRITKDAMAERGPIAEEEWVEFIAGYLHPEGSLRAICEESMRAFPGAMAHTGAVIAELAESLENLLANHRLLCLAESLFDRLQLTLGTLREEAEKIGVPSFADAVAELDRTLKALSLADDFGPSRERQRNASSKKTPRPSTSDT